VFADDARAGSRVSLVTSKTFRPHPFPATRAGQIGLVLWLTWDPISLAPGDFIEYGDALFAILSDRYPNPPGDAETALAAFLSDIRVKEMELRPDPQADLNAAWSIVDWYRWFVLGDRPPRID
jgi:hypothetical protein